MGYPAHMNDTVVRKAARQRVLKAGSIAFNRAGAIDCTIRNISPKGACLEVESPLGIPEDFILTIDRDGVVHPCHVVWRKAKRIGVVFA